MATVTNGNDRSPMWRARSAVDRIRNNLHRIGDGIHRISGDALARPPSVTGDEIVNQNVTNIVLPSPTLLTSELSNPTLDDISTISPPSDSPQMEQRTTN